MNDLTFHCELVLKNDAECAGVCDCLTVHVMNRVYHDYNGNPYEDQRRARVYVLSEFIRNYVEEITGIGSNQMCTELLLGAIQAIDFREIAEDLIGDYSPKSPAEVADSEEYFNIMGFGNYDIDED